MDTTSINDQERLTILQSDVAAIIKGAISGAIATAPMTAVMLAGKRLGLLGEMPPRLLSGVALGARGQHDPGELKAAAVATELHLYVGAANGAIYGALANRFNPPALVAGPLFGIAVWLVGYRGWMPMLKIMPPIEKDRPDRQVVLVISHLVYGGVLGFLTKKLLD